MRIYFLSLQCMLYITLLTAQDIEWAITAGSQWNEGGLRIEVDSQGNSYVAGWANANLNSSFFLGDIELKPEFSAGADLFLAKLDKNGNTLWAKTFGSFFTDQIWSMTLDRFNNIWIAGEADSSPLKIDSFSINTPNRLSAFALKISSDGDFLWGRFWDQIEQRGTFTSARCICTDQQGAIYYAGTFLADSLVIDNFTLYRAPSTSETLYLLKLNQQGEVIWARTNTSGAFSANNCVVDQNNDLYLLGGTNGGDITFDTITIVGQNLGLADPVLWKFNAEGQALWARTATGSFADFARAVAVDEDNDVYVVGEFNSRQLEFGQQILLNYEQGGDPTRPVHLDVFLAKYDQQGNLIWTQAFGNSKDDRPGDIAINSQNQVFVSGATFSPSLSLGNSIFINNQKDGNDYFIFQFSPNGQYEQGFMDGGTDNEVIIDMVFDQQDHLYFTGSFGSDTLPLGSLQLPNSYPPGNNPTSDILIAKLASLTTSLSSPIIQALPLQLFPSPANEQVHINLAATLPYTNWQMSIYDITGRLRKKVDLQQQRRYLLDTNDLENGTFIIKLYNEQKVSYTAKLMIVR